MATSDASAGIVESIEIHAPIAAVFAALTDPDQLPAWWGSDDSYHVTEMTADLRPGGEWESTGTSGDGTQFSVGGIYRIVEAPHALEFTWHYNWSGDREGAHESIVRYDVSERAGVTTVQVTHAGFRSADDREAHAVGWKIVLGWLSAYVTAPR